MKKLIFIFSFFIFLSFGFVCYAGTYDTLLNDGGYTDIHNNYISKPQLKEILNIIFKVDLEYDTDKNGHATGLDFFGMVEEELGYDSFMIPKKETYFTRALTFISLYELLDFYFPEISKLHGIDSVYGTLASTASGYTLTYGNGQVVEFEEFNYFALSYYLCDVLVITKGDKIIDICPFERNAPLSMLTDKKEVFGKLYLLYDKGIIIETEGELYEYPITSSFKFLNKGKGDNVVLILGSYKKNKNIASIAIGRTE